MRTAREAAELIPVTLDELQKVQGEVSLAELARAACVTPEHLCRVFKAAGQPSPVETVRLVRLDRAALAAMMDRYANAARTLVNGLETANDAKAYEVGFAYSGGRMHLKTFKEVTHAAP